MTHLLLLKQHGLLLGTHMLDTVATRAADARRHTVGHHRGRVDLRPSWTRDAHLCGEVLGDGARLAGLAGIMSHAGREARMPLGDAGVLLHRARVW